MSFELIVLAAASLWGFLQLVAAAQAANAQYGLKWAASPRDTEMPPLTPLPGRINRNFRNYMETFRSLPWRFSPLRPQAFTMS